MCYTVDVYVQLPREDVLGEQTIKKKSVEITTHFKSLKKENNNKKKKKKKRIFCCCCCCIVCYIFFTLYIIEYNFMSITNSFSKRDNNCSVFCDPTTDNFAVSSHVSLMIQYDDGTTHRWNKITSMQNVVQLLCGVAGSARDVVFNHYRHAGTTVYIPSTHRQKATTITSANHLPLSFFWIDIAGSLGADELDVLFDHLSVNSRTRTKWKAKTATKIALGADDVQQSFCSWPIENEGDTGTEPDEVQVFVEEQYVHFRLAAILKRNKTDAGNKNHNYNNFDTSRNSPTRITKSGIFGDSVTQSSSSFSVEAVVMGSEDHPHTNLFNSDEDYDFCSVFVLCFLRGIVTWRPTSKVEGWSFILHSIERYLSPTSYSPLSLFSSSFFSVVSQQKMTTSLLFCVIFDEICEAFLVDPTAFLNEAEAIDAMLLLVRQHESDQADALRRVLLLRRRLSAHRRLLSSKLNILEQLRRPVMRTLLAFITGGSVEDIYFARVSPPAACVPRVNVGGRDGLHVCPGTATRFHGGASFSVYNRILHLLSQLDSARTNLGNATILHTSGVVMRNNRDSNETDYHTLFLQCALLTTLPLTIVASQWGMNCYVPWQDYDSTTPFWSIVGVMALYAVLLLGYPFYCWTIGRPDKLVF